MTTLRFARHAALLTLLAVGCKDEPAPTVTQPADSAKQDAGIESPAIGGKMKDVAKTLEGKGLSAEELAKQPPPDGIFPAGVADKAHAVGAPPKLEMIKDGDEPRIMLHAAAPEPQVVGLKLQIGQKGRQVQRLVFVEIAPPDQAGKAMHKLVGDLEKQIHQASEASGASSAAPKSAPPPAAGSASPSASAAVEAPPAPPVGADRPLVATVLDFSPSGEMGKNLDASINFTATKAGAASFVRKYKKETTDPAEVVARDLQLGAVEELLLGLFSGMPDKPVGANAMWTIADRRTSLGTDVVRYRLFQVESVEGDTAHLQVMFRQYAATDTNALVQDPEIVMRGYAFEGLGKIDVSPKALFPKSGMVQVGMNSQLVPKDKKEDPQVQGQPFAIEAAMQIFDAQEIKLTPSDEQPPPKKEGGKKEGAKKQPAPAPAPQP
ncbi:MAG: hypothetical protein HOW73_37600 [Polyangiaceae bacterium]|nr:hypothetical protein [Polyangiaceae bacterium]